MRTCGEGMKRHRRDARGRAGGGKRALLVGSRPRLTVRFGEEGRVGAGVQSLAREKFAAFVGQNYVPWLSVLAGADRDGAGIRIEIFGHEIRELAEPAAGKQGRGHQQSKICPAGIDEPARLIVGQIPKTRGIDPAVRLDLRSCVGRRCPAVVMGLVQCCFQDRQRPVGGRAPAA